MSDTRTPTATDEQDYFIARDQRLGTARATDCAACRAPLPDGNRYLCTSCVADSAKRAELVLASLQPRPTMGEAAESPEAGSTAADPDEYAECPTCGMRLDPSGRCAGCVTTVRR
jgi:hypothetical protein